MEGDGTQAGASGGCGVRRLGLCASIWLWRRRRSQSAERVSQVLQELMTVRRTCLAYVGVSYSDYLPITVLIVLHRVIAA